MLNYLYCPKTVVNWKATSEKTGKNVFFELNINMLSKIVKTLNVYKKIDILLDFMLLCLSKRSCCKKLPFRLKN